MPKSPTRNLLEIVVWWLTVFCSVPLNVIQQIRVLENPCNHA
jgi:hypothetical protein